MSASEWKELQNRKWICEGTPQRAAGFLRERTGVKMRYLPDGKQMNEADRHTIEDLGVPSLVLMERAALESVETMEKAGIDTSRALVVCGSGNNGGDGFAAARILTERGRQADIVFAGKESSLSQECRIQKQIAENMGLRIYTEFPAEEYTVIIDAVFGVGLSREITGSYKDMIQAMNRAPGRKVAIDIPSGVCAGDGRVLGIAFQAELTVGMACTKLGCELYPGKNYAGQTAAVPIGIDPGFFSDRKEVFQTYEREDLSRLLPLRKPDSHKGSYGKVLMITGSYGMAGASCLAALAAYTAGAGLVQIYTPADNRVIVQQLLPEAVLSCYNGYEEEKLDELLEWADVVCIGCGLGTDRQAEQILIHTIENVKVPCVVDADGINLLSRHKELLSHTAAPLILTPHMMEMSRLTGCTVERIKENRIEILRRFTESCPAVCVLKDSRTIVAQKGNHPFINLAGNSGMAKAGSGDVLAGVITGLLAQGMTPFEGAALGVYLHACGGDESRDRLGSYSMVARDLIKGIQVCLKKAEEQKEK